MDKPISKELQYLNELKNSYKKLPSADSETLTDARYITEVLMYAYKQQNVHRLQTIHTIRPYSVALHSYYTAIIFMEICHSLALPIYSDVIRLVLLHDIAESVTGDLIYPIKNYNDETKKLWSALEEEVLRDSRIAFYSDEKIKDNLSPTHWRIFRAADLYELFIFCTTEWELGNHTAGIKQVIDNCKEYIPEFGIEPLTNGVDLWKYE